MVQTLLALFRMSRRLAVHWLKLRAAGDVSGHSEALAAPICNRAVWCAESGCERCTVSDLFDPGGVYDLGGWGLWRGNENSRWRKTSPAYTLTGLAGLTRVGDLPLVNDPVLNVGIRPHPDVYPRAMDESVKPPVWTMDFSKYKTNEEVPRNHLFHPCKCEAEIHWGKARTTKRPRKQHC